ncbi:protein archease-like [Mercenaria mercenaria]|uniref:protein archease-like n=1 Tax=Mercenaria mercenaria TaxID=6596 RepID=UPI00234E601A|nr:protein archease-like [Mercenaria mercenaria]
MAEKRERSEEMENLQSRPDSAEKHARIEEKSSEIDATSEEKTVATSGKRCNTGAEGDHIGYQENANDKYEYLDHTADVQLHAWGESLKEAFEQVVVSMFNYMTTDFSTVEMLGEQEVEAEGEDLESLLFHFMDEWLFVFSAEPFFIAKKVVITEFDKENFKIKSIGYGEEFDIQKHPQGTEVKAITYSNMQIYDDEDRHEVFVIIDI